MAWLGNLLGSLLSGESSPDKIIEVKLDRYLRRTVIVREDGLFLYDKNDPNDNYEILMHKPVTESLSLAFSLYRTSTRLDAERYFSLLKEKLPALCRLNTPTVLMVQKFCSAIKDHPSWNICHLLVYFNFVDQLQEPGALSHIHSSDPLTGMSPLQLAVKLGNVAAVNRLLFLGASVEHLDHDGNNVLHYAASTNKEMITALFKERDEGRRNILDGFNGAGQTPLHVACFSDKPDCVKALLVAGADVNLSIEASASGHRSPGLLGDFMNDYHNKLHLQEMKNGGTPLHWSSSREVIDALLDCNCNIDALNFDSKTALHVMVKNKRLECVVALLSREADPNLVDAEGNSALHIAVKEKCIPIMQALIVFGADLSTRNKAGESPRHLVGEESTDEIISKALYTLHAVGALRCSSATPSCGPGCTPAGTWDGIPTGNYTPLQRSIQEILEGSVIGDKCCARGGRVLCLDGGGIRGLVLVVLLLHLEKAAACPIVHCFDWLAATSTGAILALALAAGKTLHESLCLYFRMKDVAFAGSRPYNSEPLERILKETLGTESKMTQIQHPKLMITGCLADRKPVDLHLFRNYPSPDDIIGSGDKAGPFGLAPPPSPDNQLIWEAARASGAAPSYFRAFGRFVDGGLISNNPTFDALTEIHEYNTSLEVVGRGSEVVRPSLVVSLGTGSVPITQVESLDIFWPSGVWDAAKLVSGVRSMQAVLVDQATQADGRVVERARALCSMMGVPYFRFSPQMSEDIVMDEKSDVKLVNLLWETKAYMTSQHRTVENLASLLSA